MATHFFGDTAVLTGRTMRHVTRSPDTIVTTAIMVSSAANPAITLRRARRGSRRSM